VQHADPEVAAENVARSLAAFRQCGDKAHVERAELLLSSLRTKRSCWLCHREMQGLGLHVHWYPARIDPYVVSTVARAGQDLASLSAEDEQVALCTPCGSFVEQQAERYASERAEQVRRELQGQMTDLARVVSNLTSAVQQLQAWSHHH
jgi:hypothetical protein